jgi:hypothetical protein
VNEGRAVPCPPPGGEVGRAVPCPPLLGMMTARTEWRALPPVETLSSPNSISGEESHGSIPTSRDPTVIGNPQSAIGVKPSLPRRSEAKAGRTRSHPVKPRQSQSNRFPPVTTPITPSLHHSAQARPLPLVVFPGDTAKFHLIPPDSTWFHLIPLPAPPGGHE